MRGSSTRGRPGSGAVPALLISVLFAVAAAAQTPPGASPGGARPELPRDRIPPGIDDPASAFPIPPAIERPLDVEEGDRLFIKEFRLTGAASRLREGVDPEEVARVVEKLRIQRQGLDEVGEDGFTEDERARITEFMRGVVTDPERDMSFEQYQALVAELRARKAERDAGMTIGQMQQIAATVTEYYRSAGYILAQAFIPAQEVVDGVVEIEVLEGTLGNVLVENNERYTDELLAKPFEELLGGPVTAGNIEDAILTAGDYPGVTLFGVFQPGRQVGASDLVLRVQEEKRIDASLRFDNHGTRFTGDRRVFGNISYNNLPLTGGGDRLSLTALKQFNPSNAFFGELEYERWLFAPGMTVGASISRNPFDIGAELKAGNLSGESTVFEAYVRNSIIRSRQRNLWARLGWKRSSEITEQNEVEITSDDLSMITGELTYDSIDAETRSINYATVGGALGLGNNFGGNDQDTVTNQSVPGGRRGGSGKFASNDFYKLTASYTRLQILNESNSVLFRLEGQWTHDLLTSLEQFSIGGPNSVRAFPISEFQVDTGLFASAEWTMNAPGFTAARFTDGLTWGQVLRVSFFVDWAFGKLNSPAGNQSEITNAAGFGSALSINLPGKFQGRLEWSHPFGADVPSDGDTSRYWFDLTYQF